MSNTSPQCIQYFPVNLFASVMGMTGLSIAYQRYTHIAPIPSWISLGLLTISSILFIGISLIYIKKFFQYRNEVITEFNHPVRANFFPAISISLLLLSIAFLEIHTSTALYLWIIGSIMHLLFTLCIMTRWITNIFEINHSNPAWFIPVVGNILIPITGIEFVNVEVSWFFFSIGLFFWVTLFTIVFYRIIFHKQLPQKLLPTLFILIAPPAIGFISYTKLIGTVDCFARLLLYFAIFFTLLLFTMLPYFWRLQFFISWWAYTFPLCAVTIASILAFKLLHFTFFAYLATFLLICATLTIAFVSYKTLLAFQQKTLCKPEE